MMNADVCAIRSDLQQQLSAGLSVWGSAHAAMERFAQANEAGGGEAVITAAITAAKKTFSREETTLADRAAIAQTACEHVGKALIGLPHQAFEWLAAGMAPWHAAFWAVYQVHREEAQQRETAKKQGEILPYPKESSPAAAQQALNAATEAVSLIKEETPERVLADQELAAVQQIVDSWLQAAE